MTKRAKMILNCAMTLAIGAGILMGNSYLVHGARATDLKQNTPVMVSDKMTGAEQADTEKKNESAQVFIRNANNGYVIVSPDETSDAILEELQKWETMTEEEKTELYASMTEEERAQFNKKVRALYQAAIKEGYIIFENVSNPVFVEGTPSKNDLAEEEAIKTAKNAVVEKFALTDETLSRFSIDTAFNVVNPDQPEWCINLYPTNQNDFSEIGDYYITLKSPSGEVIKILSAADGQG